MKAYEVVGYTYEADVHCPKCAEKRFPGIGGDDADTELWFAKFQERAPDVEYRDREGNPPNACFANENDSWPHGCNCGTCGDEVFEAWCDGCEEHGCHMPDSTECDGEESAP